MVKKTVNMLKVIAYIGGKQTLENRFIQILHDAETLDGQMPQEHAGAHSD